VYLRLGEAEASRLRRLGRSRSSSGGRRTPGDHRRPAYQEATAVAEQYKDIQPDKRNFTVRESIPDLFRELAGNFLSWLRTCLADIATGILSVLIGLFVMFYLIYYLLVFTTNASSRSCCPSARRTPQADR
jgi:hypothetical protein